jgi:hypothetical protein
MAALASVVIPAHNEERVIGPTLRSLQRGLGAHELDVVVVCNGCTDRTAETVRREFPRARVVEIPEPSKVAAVAAGNAVSRAFPRVHLDADIRLSGTSVVTLVETLVREDVHAVAPARLMDRTGCSRLVAWYYDVWEQLPQVRDGLFGRGVYALSEQGEARVSALPHLMSDDLAVSDAFDPVERRVVPTATARVVPPRHARDLVRRRVRIVTGGVQAEAAGFRDAASVTRFSTLVGVCRRSPLLALKMPVFLAIGLVARLQARRAVRAGDFHTWLRDESSRA